MPKVTDKDHGAKARLRELSKKGRISVGIHQEQGAASHSGGADMATIASFHEFGEGVPRRSFVRDWFDGVQQKWQAVNTQQARLVAAGKQTAAVGFERVALWSQGDMQKRIADGIPPALAASTVAAKGSDVPLIDTGQLRASILGRAVVK